jgi:hypothetical protein
MDPAWGAESPSGKQLLLDVLGGRKLPHASTAVPSWRGCRPGRGSSECLQANCIEFFPDPRVSGNSAWSALVIAEADSCIPFHGQVSPHGQDSSDLEVASDGYRSVHCQKPIHFHVVGRESPMAFDAAPCRMEATCECDITAYVEERMRGEEQRAIDLYVSRNDDHSQAAGKHNIAAPHDRSFTEPGTRARQGLLRGDQVLRSYHPIAWEKFDLMI